MSVIENYCNRGSVLIEFSDGYSWGVFVGGLLVDSIFDKQGKESCPIL